MVPFPINYEFVLLAAILNMVIGFLWYGPLFGAPWMKLMDRKPSDIEKIKQNSQMAKTYGITFFMALVSYYVLAIMINYTAASTYLQGATTGFWLWLGFVAPVQATDVLYGTKKPKLFIINTGYQLTVLLLNGAILARWV